LISIGPENEVTDMDLCNIHQIKELLARHGFRFSKSMGQNFLTAPWVPRRIAEEAGLDSGTGVLEVGPGVGCLTEQLALRAGKVLSIELDKTLKPALEEALQGLDNIELLFGDVLKFNLPELVRQHFPGLRPVVCANLPYNITSPVLTAFIEAGCFDTITVMIQREVARRLVARPGSQDYGSFTVYVNWHTETKILFDVPPGCFIPQPKVSSTVIRLKKRNSPPAQVGSEEMFFKVVRGAFSQRRKTLKNALASALEGFEKERIEEAISACGLDLGVRGEALGIGEFAALADALMRLSS
jgi:16S rRNA (adenine1518-N6/adenine1519-N6)-dimethyltransferase